MGISSNAVNIFNLELFHSINLKKCADTWLITISLDYKIQLPLHSPSYLPLSGTPKNHHLLQRGALRICIKCLCIFCMSRLFEYWCIHVHASDRTHYGRLSRPSFLVLNYIHCYHSHNLLPFKEKNNFKI